LRPPTYELADYSNSPSNGQIVRAEYICSSCLQFRWIFYLRFGENCDAITKIGQWPPWSIQVDPALAQMLGDHVSGYQKGLVCESQGYGIGAFAYYRRIVEGIIGRLLDDIGDLISENERAAYHQALEQTKKTTVTQEKIGLVKDLLPPILRPDGMNPLALLHSILSEGLHERSDADCLEDAQSIREVLVFLVNQVLQSKESAKLFTAGMRKLLDRKSKNDM
jgi:hypothetical protein